MGEHTPGPWSSEMVRTSCGVCFRIGPLGISNGKPNYACIYADYPGQMVLELGEANARAIAALPELLAALKLFEAFYPMGVNLELDDAVRKARAAIAKAEGRT